MKTLINSSSVFNKGKIMDLKYLLLAALFIITVSTLFSCKDNTVEPVYTGSISGKIIDEGSTKPVTGVAVTTSPASDAVITDEGGVFTLSDLSVGSYSITAIKNGYKKSVTNVSVKKDAVTQANIYLQAGSDTYAAPNTPVNSKPADNASSQNINIDLVWSSSNKSADSIKFDVYMFTSDISSKQLIAENLKDTSFSLSSLDYNTTYFWQIVAKNPKGDISNGDVWSFVTRNFPDNPFYYISNASGDYQIYTTDSTSANTIRLTANSFNELSPRINHKRGLVAFVSNKELDLGIYTVDKQGKNLIKISQIPIAGYNNNGSGFDWSPDGSFLIYPNNDKLMRIAYYGGTSSTIASAPADRHFREAGYNSKGDKIAALTMGQNFYDSEIYMMNSDGSNMQLVVDNLPGAVGSPSFSPNDKSIMYTNDVDGYQSSDNRQTNTHIFIKDLSSGTVTDISKNKPAGTNDLEPRFSPDGGKIIFTNCRNDGINTSVWIMDITGDNRTKIAVNGRMPDWN